MLFLNVILKKAKLLSPLTRIGLNFESADGNTPPTLINEAVGANNRWIYKIVLCQSNKPVNTNSVGFKGSRPQNVAASKVSSLLRGAGPPWWSIIGAAASTFHRGQVCLRRCHIYGLMSSCPHVLSEPKLFHVSHQSHDLFRWPSSVLFLPGHRTGGEDFKLPPRLNED